jgi:hypothetical protein
MAAGYLTPVALDLEMKPSAKLPALKAGVKKDSRGRIDHRELKDLVQHLPCPERQAVLCGGCANLCKAFVL